MLWILAAVIVVAYGLVRYRVTWSAEEPLPDPIAVSAPRPAPLELLAAERRRKG
jgi:hypothetical protein